MIMRLSVKFLICAFVFGQVSSGNAATILVPTNYSTIQAAVINAMPGDVIVVSAGTYNESVNINLMGTPGNITIMGSGGTSTLVDGGLTLPAFTASSFNGNITIDGFYLDANNTDPAFLGVIVLTNINGVANIKNNSFVSDHQGASIYVSCNGSTMMGLNVDNNSATYVIAGGNDDFLEIILDDNVHMDLTANGNTLVGCEDDGISMIVRGTSTIDANITNNSITSFIASGEAIDLNVGTSSTGANAHVVIEGNTCSGTFSGDGILLSINGNNTILEIFILDNLITGNDDSGINFLVNSTTSNANVGFIIDGNTISGNGGDPITTGYGISLDAETKTIATTSAFNYSIINNALNGNDAGILLDFDDVDNNCSVCLNIEDNSVATGVPFAEFLLNTIPVSLFKGSSSSSNALVVLSDNGNTGSSSTITGGTVVIASTQCTLPSLPAAMVCPTIGAATGSSSICQNESFTVSSSGLSAMDAVTNGDVNFGIKFEYFSSAPSDPYLGGTTLGTVPFSSLTLGNTLATLSGLSISTPGSYLVYAILSPNPTDGACRPFKSFGLSVVAGSTWYQDADIDGYGNPSSTTLACAQPIGYVSNANDCDDTNSSLNINPTYVFLGQCYETLGDALMAAGSSGTIEIFGNANPISINTIPSGVTINVNSGACWTNTVQLTNNGSIVLLGTGKFINDGTGIYKGNGILNGALTNNGMVRPGN